MDLATRAKINFFKSAVLGAWELTNIYEFAKSEFVRMCKSKRQSKRDRVYSDTMEYYKEVARIAKGRLKGEVA